MTQHDVPLRPGDISKALVRVFVIGILTLGTEDVFSQSQHSDGRGFRPVEYHDTSGRRIGAYWQEATEGLPDHSEDACLELLQPTEQLGFSGDLALGRVFSAGEVVEPVLLRKTSVGGQTRYSFRDCRSGFPVEADLTAADQEAYQSALVARFSRERTKALKTYYEVPFFGYKLKDQTADFVFPGAGAMLEARRLDSDHIEITGTPSVQIIPSERIKVTVLLVASRHALDSMRMNVWDEDWGDHWEDPRIECEIIWCELFEKSKELKVHSAAQNFDELARRATEWKNSFDTTGQTGEFTTRADTDWKPVVERSLKLILERAAFALVVVDQTEQFELALEVYQQAAETNSDANLEVAALEEVWTKKDLERLAGKGRHFRLIRLYDLAAIMPDRVAGKIRAKYSRLIPQPSDVVDARFTKDYVALTADSPAYSLGNAMFLDQTVVTAKMIRFLECLHDDVSKTLDTATRLEMIEKGFEEVGFPFESLGEMDVGEAFQYLFEGFSLPVGLTAREHGFLKSISTGEPEVLRLLRTLRSYFDTISLETDACKVVLLPDNVLLTLLRDNALPGAPIEEKSVMTVDSMPKLPSQGPLDLYARARLAGKRARKALADAMKVEGWRCNKDKIQQGNRKLDKGNKILYASTTETTADLENAISAFQKAEKTYMNARDFGSSRCSKSRIRVH